MNLSLLLIAHDCGMWIEMERNALPRVCEETQLQSQICQGTKYFST